MTYKQQSIYTTSLWVFLLVFMTLTNPTGLPVAFFVVPFILLFLAFYSSWRLSQATRSRYLRSERPNQGRRLGFVVCISVVLLIVLQSLGQLTLRDSITVIALAAIGYLYVMRRKPIKP